ncbi:MAG: hypothetical protein DIU83_11525, partial [Bacillota bacterium]
MTPSARTYTVSPPAASGCTSSARTRPSDSAAGVSRPAAPPSPPARDAPGPLSAPATASTAKPTQSSVSRPSRRRHGAPGGAAGFCE